MTPSERALHEAWSIDGGDSWCSCSWTQGKQIVCLTHEKIAMLLDTFAADAVREEREALERLIIQYDKAGGIHVGKLLAAIRARTPASGEEKG